MPTGSRLLLKNVCYHIITRGNQNQRVFLAKKDYESGMTYMHMEYYKAATYYFDLILDKYHDTEYAEPALLKKVEALTNRKKYTDAKEAVDKFLIKYPTSNMKSDAERMCADIEAKISEDKAQKQKKFEPIKDTGKQLPQSGS